MTNAQLYNSKATPEAQGSSVITLEPTPAVIDSKSKRREQNKIAQRKYR